MADSARCTLLRVVRVDERGEGDAHDPPSEAGVRESLEDAGRWGPREVAKDGIVRFVPNQGWRLAYSACIER